MLKSDKHFLRRLYDRVTGNGASRKASRLDSAVKGLKARGLSMEHLEDRQLLAVSNGEMLDISSTYSQFDLSTTSNIIELPANSLNAKNLATAIATAQNTSGDDLILIRTQDEFFTIDLEDTTQLIESTAQSGTITIIAYGETPLTITSNNATTLSVTSGKVNLGNINIVGTEQVDPVTREPLTTESPVLFIGASANVTQADVTTAKEQFYTTVTSDDRDVKVVYNDDTGIWSVDFAMTSGLGASLRSYVTGLGSATEALEIAETFSSLTNNTALSHTKDGKTTSITDPVDAEIGGIEMTDSYLSWAATTANMLYYSGWGNKVGLTEDAIYEYLLSNFSNGKYYVEGGLEWFMNGELYNYDPSWTILDDGAISSVSKDANLWASRTSDGGNVFGSQFAFDEYGGSFNSRTYYQSRQVTGMTPVSQMLEAGYAVSVNMQTTTTTTLNTYDGVSDTYGDLENASLGTPTVARAYDYEVATGSYTIWGYVYNASIDIPKTSTNYYVGLYVTDPTDNTGTPTEDQPDNLVLKTMDWVGYDYVTITDPADDDLSVTKYDGYTYQTGANTYIDPDLGQDATWNQTADATTGQYSFTGLVIANVTEEYRIYNFSFMSAAPGRTPVEADPYEPNNNAQTVDALLVTDEYSSNLGVINGYKEVKNLNLIDYAKDPEDWFKFKTEQTSSSGDYVAVQYAKTLFSGDVEIYLYHRVNGVLTLLTDYSAVKTKISQTDIYGKGEDVYELKISLAGLDAGDYYVQVVRSNKDFDCKSYNLMLNAASDDEYEVNNTLEDLEEAPISTVDHPTANFGALSENIVLSDLVMKQYSTSSTEVSEVDGFRFEMTGTGGPNSYVEIQFADTTNNINDSYLELRVFKKGSEEYYQENETSWGDLITGEKGKIISASGAPMTIVRVSLDGCTPGVYYIKVTGFINAQNLLNYKLNVHLRNDDDPAGIGVTSMPDFVVAKPEDQDWEKAVVITKELYEQHDTEGADDQVFSNDPYFFSQDTLYMNLSYYVANDSNKDATTYNVQVSLLVNGTELKYIEEITLKGEYETDAELRDAIFAKLTDSIELSVKDGKMINNEDASIWNWADVMEDGMVISVVDSLENVQGGYIFKGGKLIAISDPSTITNGDLVVLQDNAGNWIYLTYNTTNVLVNGEKVTAVYQFNDIDKVRYAADFERNTSYSYLLEMTSYSSAGSATVYYNTNLKCFTTAAGQRIAISSGSLVSYTSPSTGATTFYTYKVNYDPQFGTIDTFVETLMNLSQYQSSVETVYTGVTNETALRMADSTVVYFDSTDKTFQINATVAKNTILLDAANNEYRFLGFSATDVTKGMWNGIEQYQGKFVQATTGISGPLYCTDGSVPDTTALYYGTDGYMHRGSATGEVVYLNDGTILANSAITPVDYYLFTTTSANFYTGSLWQRADVSFGTELTNSDSTETYTYLKGCFRTDYSGSISDGTTFTANSGAVNEIDLVYRNGEFYATVVYDVTFSTSAQIAIDSDKVITLPNDDTVRFVTGKGLFDSASSSRLTGAVPMTINGQEVVYTGADNFYSEYTGPDSGVRCPSKTGDKTLYYNEADHSFYYSNDHTLAFTLAAGESCVLAWGTDLYTVTYLANNAFTGLAEVCDVEENAIGSVVLVTDMDLPVTIAGSSTVYYYFNGALYTDPTCETKYKDLADGEVVNVEINNIDYTLENKILENGKGLVIAASLASRYATLAGLTTKTVDYLYSINDVSFHAAYSGNAENGIVTIDGVKYFYNSGVAAPEGIYSVTGMVTVTENGLMATYGTDAYLGQNVFFTDGTQLLFFGNDDGGFAASYLMITPSDANTKTLDLYKNDVDFIIYSADGLTEYNVNNNKASTAFNVFRTQDDFFVPNATFEEMINSNNPEVYNQEIADQYDSTDSINPNLGAISSTVVIENLVMLTGEDWFSCEIQGETTVANTVRIDFLHELGDLDLYVYIQDDTYPNGYRLVGRSSTLNDFEEVALGTAGPGTYYIRVVGFAHSNNPNYSLTIVGSEPMPLDGVQIELDEPIVINSAALISWEKVDAEEDYVYGGPEEFFSATEIQWISKENYETIKAQLGDTATEDEIWESAEEAGLVSSTKAERYATKYTINSYLGNELQPETTYYYRARGLNNNKTNGQTAWTTKEEFETEDFFNDTKYYAIIIGSSVYNTGTTYDYMYNDAQSVYSILLENAPQYTKDQIYYLNGKVTLQQITQAFEQVGQVAGSNDVVFVYYTGLGTTATVGPETASSISTYSSSISVRDFYGLFAENLNVGEVQIVMNPYYFDSAELNYKDFGYTEFGDILINGYDANPALNSTISVVTNANNGENVQLNANKETFYGKYLDEALTLKEENGNYVADTNGDGRLSMKEIYEYTEPRVLTASGELMTGQYQTNKNNWESIIIKGTWKETIEYLSETGDWWNNDSIVVTTGSDVVDSTDGLTSLREAIDNYLGSTIYGNDQILYDGTIITIEGNTDPESFKYGTTDILTKDNFTIDDTTYRYSEGLVGRVGNRPTGDILLNNGDSFTYAGNRCTYTLEDTNDDGIDEIVIRDENGNDVTAILFPENTSVLTNVLLDSGQTVTLRKSGVMNEAKVLNKITFADDLSTITVEKAFEIDNKALENVAADTAVFIDGSAHNGDLVLDAANKTRHFTITYDETNTDDPINTGISVNIVGMNLINGYADADAEYGAIGGSIYNAGENVWLVNTVLTNNGSDNDNGFLTDQGGAIYNAATGSMTIVNSNIVANSAQRYAVYNAGGTMNVYNSIIDFNNADSGQAGKDLSSTNTVGILVRNSMIGAHSYQVVLDTTNVDNATKTWTAEQIFKNLAEKDFNIVNGAPVINKANIAYSKYSDGSKVETDLGGYSRSLYGKVDMGAYEWKSTLAMDTVVTTLNDIENISDNVTSLREAVSYAGQNYPLFNSLDDLEGEELVINEKTVYVNNGKLYDDAGLFTDYKNGDAVTIVSSDQTGKISIENGITTIETMETAGTDIVFNLDAIIANTLDGSGNQRWADAAAFITDLNGKANVLTVELDNGAIGIYNTVTVDGTNLTSANADVIKAVSDMTVTNSENAILTYQAANSGGTLFTVDSGDSAVQFTNLTLANGLTSYVNNASALNIASGTVSVKDVDFNNNQATEGAAIYANGGTITVANSDFTGNKTNTNGGAIYASADITITNSVFTGNTVTSTTGAGGAVYLGANAQNAVIANSTFTNNGFSSIYGTSRGGALYAAQNVKLTLTSDTFLDNTAANGGAIFISVDASVTANKITAQDNRATNGGAVYNAGRFQANYSGLNNNTATKGGGLYNVGTGRAILLADQISGNIGGGIYDESAYSGTEANSYTVTVANSIISGNTQHGGITSTNNSAIIYVVSSSIVGNRANRTAGYGINAAGTLQLWSSVVSWNNNDISTNANVIASSIENPNNSSLIGGSPTFAKFNYTDNWNTWDLSSQDEINIIAQGDTDFIYYYDFAGNQQDLIYDKTGRQARTITNGILVQTDRGAIQNGKQIGELSLIVNTLDDYQVTEDCLYDDVRSLAEVLWYFENSTAFEEITGRSIESLGESITFADAQTLLANTGKAYDTPYKNGEIDLDTNSFTIHLNQVLDLTSYISIDGSIANVEADTTAYVIVNGDNELTPFMMRDSSAHVTITNMTVTDGYNENKNNGNTATAGNGGAFYINDGYLILEKVFIKNNFSDIQGGGIYINGAEGETGNARLRLTNVEISGNTAEGINTGAGEYGGGGIYAQSAYLTAVNSTIVGNEAQNFSGLYAVDSSIVLYNTVIAGNYGLIADGIDFYSKDVNQNAMYNNIIGAMSETQNLNGINGNKAGTQTGRIDESQIFNDYVNGDYTLGLNSIAINTGNNYYAKDAAGLTLKDDILGNDRYLIDEVTSEPFGIVDIGAYENTEVRDEFTTVVTTIIDVNDKTDGKITLREAFENAKQLGTAITFDTEAILANDNIASNYVVNLVNGTGYGVFTVDNDQYKIVIDATGLEGGLTITAPTEENIFDVSLGKLELKSVILTGGRNKEHGGAIYETGGSVSLTNCLLFDNSAIINGQNFGNAIYNNSGSLTMLNTTVAGNFGVRSAVYVTGATANVSIKNSIITNNNATSTASPDDLYISSDVYDEDDLEKMTVSTSILGTIGGYVNKSHNFSSSYVGIDPEFETAAEFDTEGNITNLTALNFRLQYSSPAVNAGANASVGRPGYLANLPDDLQKAAGNLVVSYDLEGNNRIHNGIVDIGAYEFSEDFESPAIIVTTIQDVIDPTDGLISLREAIKYAGTSFIDTEGKTRTVGMNITFDTDAILANDNVADNYTITLDAELGAIVVDKGVTIDASAIPGGVTIDADSSIDSARRVFEVATGFGVTAQLVSLTITGGDAGIGNGGAIALTSGELYVVNCVIYGNTAQKGGAIAVSGANTTLQVVNTTITKNNAEKEYGGIYSLTGKVNLANTLVAWSMHLTGSEFYDGNYNFQSLYNNNDRRFSIDCYIANGTYYSSLFSIADTNRPILGVNGSISGTAGSPVDPYFLDWDTNDFRLGKDLSAVNSPAINAGDNSKAVLVDGTSLTYDVDGNARFIAVVEIGAYESTLSAGEIRNVIVTTTEDIVNYNDGLISLREAIEYAGTNGLGTTITFNDTLVDASGNAVDRDSDGFYTLHLNKALDIAKTVRIDASRLGQKITLTTADNVNDRIFTVNSGEVELVGLTLTNRYTERSGRVESFTVKQGGAIYLDSGTLTVINTLIYDCYAEYGGAIYMNEGEAVRLNLFNTTITDNTTRYGAVYNAGNGYLGIYNTIIARNNSSATGATVQDVLFSNVAAMAKLTLYNNFIHNSSQLFTYNQVNGNSIGTNGSLDYESINYLFTDWANDDFTLMDFSLAVNGGNNAYVVTRWAGTDALGNPLYYADNLSTDDVVGNNRVYGKKVDIGAYENNRAKDNPYSIVSDEITVTTNVDKLVSDASDGFTTMREAIELAERLLKLGIEKTITFSSYELGEKPTMVLGNQTLTITRGIKIDASAVDSFTIDCAGKNSAFRIVSNDSEPVILQNLIIKNGYNNYGGGIYLEKGSLWLLNDLIDSCEADYGSTASIGNTYGGGVFAASGTELLLVNCTVANNTADYGGGIYAEAGTEVNVYNSIIATNKSDDVTNTDLELKGTFDVKYSLIGNSTKLYNVYGANGNYNKIGYGPDNILDPEFAAGGFTLYPDHGNNPAIDSAFDEYITAYGITVDLKGASFTENELQINARHAQELTQRLRDLGYEAWDDYVAQLEVIISDGTNAQLILDELSNNSRITIDELKNMYFAGKEQMDTANSALGLLEEYRLTTAVPTITDFKAFLTAQRAAKELAMVNQITTADPSILSVEQLKSALEAQAQTGANLYDCYLIIDASGATNRAELIDYLDGMVQDTETAQFIQQVIRQYAISDPANLDLVLAELAVSETDMGAYQVAQDERSLVVTTLEDNVDYFDGLTSLREAIAYSNSFDNIADNSYSSIGGTYTDPVSFSEYYSSTIRLVNMNPITFSKDLAGGTINMNSNLGSYLINYGAASVGYGVHDVMIDASSIAKLGGITINANGCDTIFSVEGRFSDIPVVDYCTYLELVGVALTGATQEAISIDAYSAAEVRDCLIYNNGSGIYVYDEHPTRNQFYGVLNVVNSTIVDNFRYGIYNYGRVSLFNSIVAFNGRDLDMYNFTSANAVPPPAYRVTHINYSLVTSYGFYNGGYYTTNNSVVYTRPSSGADAIFVDRAAHDYRLKDGSLAINAGNNDYRYINQFTHDTPDLDIQGNNRVYGIIDMGAFERNDVLDNAGTEVTTSLDIVDANDGMISLREAITFAEQVQEWDLFGVNVDNGSPVDPWGHSFSLFNNRVTFNTNDIRENDGLEADDPIVIKLDDQNGVIRLNNDIWIDGRNTDIVIDGDGKSGIFQIDIDSGVYKSDKQGRSLDNPIPGTIDVLIEGLTLTGGYAEKGGAINTISGNVYLWDVDIYGNEATWYGGAIYQAKDELTITNSRIGGNKAAYYGGVVNYLGSILMVNSTIAENIGTIDKASNKDVYIKAVINDEGSYNNLLGKTAVIALAGDGTDDNWIANKDGIDINLELDPPLTDEAIFAGYWEDGQWKYDEDTDHGLQVLWTPPKDVEPDTSNSQSVEASSYAAVVSAALEDDNFDWLAD